MRFVAVISRLRVEWLRLRGHRLIDTRSSVHFSVDISNELRGQIEIRSGASIGRRSWLNVPGEAQPGVQPKIIIAEGTSVGRDNVISAINGITIGEDCVTGPQVLIMDHGHQFHDVTKPILHQGVTAGGRIIIEDGCWIGFGAAVICNRGVLRIGKNSVIGANSVVTGNVPPRSVVGGVPARLIHQYNDSSASWVHRVRAEKLENSGLEPIYLQQR